MINVPFLIDRDGHDFHFPLVTVDETWVHYYEPENKAQSRQWVGPGSPRPKKFKTQPSADKMMATVVWDTEGVIMLDLLAKRSTITGVYCANWLDQLRTTIHEKHRGKLSKGVLPQQDNAARGHTCKGRVSIRGFSWYLNMSIIFWEQVATYRGHASPKTLNQLKL